MHGGEGLIEQLSTRTPPHLIHWGRHVCILKSYLGQPPVDVFRDLGVDLRVAAPPELDRLVLAHRVVAILNDN